MLGLFRHSIAGCSLTGVVWNRLSRLPLQVGQLIDRRRVSETATFQLLADGRGLHALLEQIETSVCGV